MKALRQKGPHHRVRRAAISVRLALKSDRGVQNPVLQGIKRALKTNA